jgi:hypothetical protein
MRFRTLTLFAAVAALIPGSTARATTLERMSLAKMAQTAQLMSAPTASQIPPRGMPAKSGRSLPSPSKTPGKAPRRAPPLD